MRGDESWLHKGQKCTGSGGSLARKEEEEEEEIGGGRGMDASPQQSYLAVEISGRRNEAANRN